VYKLAHFSLYYAGDGIWINLDTARPIYDEDQLKDYLRRLIQQEREALLNGKPGDPLFAQKLIELLKTYYQAIILPELPDAVADCDRALQVIPKAMGWSRNTQLLLGDGASALQQETDSVATALTLAADNCWKTRQPCLVRTNTADLSQALALARQNQLLGGDPSVYDPAGLPSYACDPALVQGQKWALNLKFTWTLAGRRGEVSAASSTCWT
jgi:hypothetical protein